MTARRCLAPGADPVLGVRMVPREAHAGLVWARYLAMWEGDRHRPSAPSADARKRVLAEFAADFNDRAQGPRNGPRDLLRLHRERLGRALEAWATGRQWVQTSLDARVTWRLVTGLGNPHPLEVNLAFDPLIGVPFLSGSSVKGLCRQAATVLGEQPAEIERLFGPDLAPPQAGAAQGRTVFFDAFPRRWPVLEVDLINCHHGGYYGQDLRRSTESINGPRETEDPIPLHFLGVGAGTDFVFHLAAGTQTDLSRVVTLLREALTLLGIGGKTSVGYGVMETLSQPEGRLNNRR